MIAVTRSGSPSEADRIGREAGEEIKTIAGPKFKDYGEAVLESQAVALAEKNAAAAAAGK